MKKYHLVNNILGWLVCAVACTVYILTAEATASWWDCGEYIATAFKLQVGHPPGAPTFQLIGRIFSMFTDPMHAANAVNIMSATASGFCIMFLFWTITLLGKKIVLKQQGGGELSLKDSRVWAVFGAGIIGALAYTFSDTFWFSAVEGEVYAMSSFFTAVVFWAILKWDEQADDPFSMRWVILICFLVGIAIGVHLLNLLTIPAIVYMVYFKKWEKVTVKGFIVSGVVSFVLLALVLWGVIPWIVNVDSAFDVFFVNNLHLPFNSGTVVYFLLLAAAIVWAIIYGVKKSKPIVTSSAVGLLMLVLGYSTFFLLVIRANTNTPLNENAPKDAVAMRAYLGREQYGQTPVFSGQYYTAGDPIDVKDGYAKYVRGKDEQGRDRYIVAAHAQNFIYRKEHTGVFPRMYSNDNGRQHPLFYKYWAGEPTPGHKPSMSQNLRYFNGYQMGWMYWRYFMWNFAGRQNDIQGHYFNDDGTRDYIHGNWISGIKFIDEARLGPQDNLPDDLANNKARNRYYLLPLLLGIIGLVYHCVRHPKDTFVVVIMFVMTGIAIGVYLNMPPRQPRERDYAFVGSFYFFAVWIGMAVMALSEWLANLLKRETLHKIIMPVVFVGCFFAAPYLMASENWDDHDRSQKTAARDFATNYLSILNPNSVLITFGDNDTFPLWYAQEVEGVRTDVRILNYTLAGMYWYVEQLYNKTYEGDPLEFTLPKEFYGLGQDVVYIQPRTSDYMEVKDMLRLLKEHPESFKAMSRDGNSYYVLPTRRFKITLDVPDLVARGVIPAEIADRVNPEIRWEIKKGNLYRHELMMLDIIGTNAFKRDICIMNPGYIKDVFPLANGFSMEEGMVYKLLPYPAQQRYTDNTADYYINGIVNADGSRTPLKWGNLNADIYVDPISLNMGTVQRQNFTIVGEELMKQGDTASARTLFDMSEEYFPTSNFPRDKYCNYMIPDYMALFGIERAGKLWDDIFEYYRQDMVYYAQYVRSSKREHRLGVRSQVRDAVQLVNTLRQQASIVMHDDARRQKAEELLNQYPDMVEMAMQQ
ncbi:MAG: DUF2723 domain-containing protein [Bacteroidales bacterium]|nr:DUF2723 domain-containing protein [Bacteroidales bacterium]